MMFSIQNVIELVDIDPVMLGWGWGLVRARNTGYTG